MSAGEYLVRPVRPHHLRARVLKRFSLALHPAGLAPSSNLGVSRLEEGASPAVMRWQ